MSFFRMNLLENIVQILRKSSYFLQSLLMRKFLFSRETIRKISQLIFKAKFQFCFYADVIKNKRGLSRVFPRNTITLNDFVHQKRNICLYIHVVTFFSPQILK